MAAYVTTAEVVARIGTVTAAQLTSDAGDTPDTARIDPIVDEANARVQAAACQRTSTAITLADHPTTWNLLKGLAMAIAVYGVHSLRTPVPDDVKARNDAAVIVLDKIADGSRCLPDASLTGTTAAWGSKDPNLSTLRDYT